MSLTNPLKNLLQNQRASAATGSSTTTEPIVDPFYERPQVSNKDKCFNNIVTFFKFKKKIQ